MRCGGEMVGSTLKLARRTGGVSHGRWLGLLKRLRIANTQTERGSEGTTQRREEREGHTFRFLHPIQDESIPIDGGPRLLEDRDISN
jgi:hypothetical protein